MHEQLPGELRGAYAAIRAAFPDGVQEPDYLPLLAALHDEFSDEALAKLVAAVTGKEVVVVDNDHAAAVSVNSPRQEDVQRIAERLQAAGYRRD